MQEIIDKNILDSKIVGRFEPRIYAFSTNTIPNHLKVGDTYRPVDERLKEWKDVYPLLEKRFEDKATINDELFFRDYSVHQYLENNLSKERINPINFPNEKYISMEFFKDTEVKDIEESYSSYYDSIETSDGYELTLDCDYEKEILSIDLSKK